MEGANHMKYDSQIIDEELQLAMKREKGLTIIPAPTGSGKSYNLELNMCRFGKKHLENPESCHYHRMVILYPNKVNIPKEKDLEERIKQIIRFRTDEQAKTWIKHNILYCKNNLECLIDGVTNYPNLIKDLKQLKNLGRYDEEIKSILDNLKQYASFINNPQKSPNTMSEFVKNATLDKANDSEKNFRQLMRSYMHILRNKIKTAKKKKDQKSLAELNEEKKAGRLYNELEHPIKR